VRLEAALETASEARRLREAKRGAVTQLSTLRGD
jgi:hypothetical protein